jgi:hypothetical protein
MILATLLSVSCYSTTVLAPGATDVLITESADEVVGCTDLGRVDGPLITNSLGILEQRHYDNMKNQTAVAGGNVLLITNRAPNTFAMGEAYRCGTPPKK